MTETFDFIVVGGGTAGAIVAARLSENGSYRVLLLEAGGANRRWDTAIPAGYGATYLDPTVNWKYTTLPEEGLNGREIYLPAGKGLGGSGAINAMLFVRGQQADFADWADDSSEWAWPEILRCFNKVETTGLGDDVARGRSGPVHVEPCAQPPLANAFFEGLAALGVPANGDYNATEQEGYGAYQLNIRNGLRSSTASTYLAAARRRHNLRVMVHAEATRLKFEGRSVVGVEVRHKRRLATYRARCEVIVCAGAIRSPHLLQCSGVGDTQALSRAGIVPHLDAPQVGQGLQDHFSCLFVLGCKQPTLNTELNTIVGKAKAAARYALTRQGPLGSSLFTSGAFVCTHRGAIRPDLQLLFAPASFVGIGRKSGGRFSLDPVPAYSVLMCPLQPQSRGQVGLHMVDERLMPVVAPGYLSTPDDCAAAVAGVRYVQKLFETAAMCAISDAPLIHMPPPNAGDEAVLAWVRACAGSVYHPVGTCRMGRDSSDSVVDAKLRVHGLAGLRIIDASVMPNITSGNTNAPVMMIAERGAEMVLEDAQNAAGVA